MINHLIPESILEAIPVRIYSILKKEFDNQAYTYSDTAFVGLKIMKERMVPIDKVETDMITIMTATGEYNNQSVGSHHASPYTFIVEFITKAKSNITNRGDELATARLIRLMMKARYILMSPLYLRLEVPEKIEGTAISKMQIYKEERIGDASDIATGQLIFTVNCEEVSEGNPGILLTQNDTNVRIELTEQGFEYTQP